MGQQYIALRSCSFTFLLIALLSGTVQAATVTAGDIAPNFTLREHGTSNFVSLRDYAGEVIVLDFFAPWCGPCQTASSELEPYIQEYFENRGGNNHGVPVRLISVNVDNSDPNYVDNYINYFGLELAVDDTAYNDVFSTYGSGPIPQFAIINGAQSENYDPWEILYLQTGYGSGGYFTFRNYINSVIPVQIPGDTNHDNIVNHIDAAILASNWQRETASGQADGDFNGDGWVTEADATILAANWQPAGNSSKAAPEPSIICLLASLASVWLCMRRRRLHNGNVGAGG